MRRHCNGPEKRVLSEVWRRTFMVSKGWPTEKFVSCVFEDEKIYLPLSFAIPENTPATKPL